MEKKNAFTITRARPEDAAALLDYLKIVGGETDNLSFGAEGVPLAPEEEQAKVLAFIQTLDIKAIATEVMYKLFAMLEMKYDFKLSMDGETEETT